VIIPLGKTLKAANTVNLEKRGDNGGIHRKKQNARERLYIISVFSGNFCWHHTEVFKRSSNCRKSAGSSAQSVMKLLLQIVEVTCKILQDALYWSYEAT
jgi:hypothetical protein